jgi:hypothetical protein
MGRNQSALKPHRNIATAKQMIKIPASMPPIAFR